MGGLGLYGQLQLLLQTMSSLWPDLCSLCLLSCIPLSAEKGTWELQYLGRFAFVATAVAR